MSRQAPRRSQARRAPAGRGRARRSAPASSTPLGPVLATIGVLVAVIAVIYFMTREPHSVTPQKPAQNAAQPQESSEPVRRDSSARPAKSGRGRVEPERPQPAVTDEAMAESRELYSEAKELFNEALLLQKAGKDKKRFLELMGDSKRKIDAACKNLEPFMIWYEEADLGDWRISAQAERINDEIAEWVKLQARAHKVSVGH